MDIRACRQAADCAIIYLIGRLLGIDHSCGDALHADRRCEEATLPTGREARKSGVRMDTADTQHTGTQRARAMSL